MEDFIKWISVCHRYSASKMDHQLEPYNLKSNQIMYIIRICDKPGLSQSEFFSLFYVNPSNITRNITYLEKQGYLKKQVDPNDKRSYHLYPTKKAIDICDHLKQIKSTWQETLLTSIPLNEREVLGNYLKIMAQNAIQHTKEENYD